MSRAVRLTKLLGVVAFTVLLAACERSATAPTAPSFAPRLDRGGLERNAQIEAPAHLGGQVARTVGRWGGRLEFDDPSARGIHYRLDIPWGALSGTTTITMRVGHGRNYEVALTAVDDDRPVEHFAWPVRLTISYSTARHPAPPAHLLVACVHDDGSFEVVRTQVNAGQRTATGYLPHFSKWTIIAN